MLTPDFEQLGSFYLGRRYDLEQRRRTDQPILYESRDLVTHALCVGMTGSGKTGLCLGLLEEAAIDGIPAIIIDPKGDLGNLLLTFPNLAPQDFLPWINPDDARKAGQSPADFAQSQAAAWKAGLAQWGQDASRIARLREAADFAIYTPGSSAGLQVSVLRSFDAPDQPILDDPELFQERVSTTVTSLLGLIGINADPVQSREHILLSTIFSHGWSRGENLDLPTIIHRIQQPPVPRVGVLDVDTFFPAEQRFTLAMQVNNLIASPGFSRWMDGQKLDIQSLLYTPQGKPRHAIFSISHLSDAERMFFVSLLLNQVLGWVRTQPGTTSLRAILYMDEIAGYFPPVAMPPSKRPLLTLMKQARAQGLGVVLATQNPVDIDYKGLSNAGTWFIGRLQTDRDKQRVLDGLEGASTGAMDRAAMDRALSALSSRVFLMHNVHEAAPVVFETRWAMSYLRGPLTRDEIRTLTAAHRTPAAGNPASSTSPAASATAPARSPAASASPSAAPGPRPMLPPDVPQYFLPPASPTAIESAATLLYKPMLLGLASIHYTDAKSGIDLEESVSLLAPLQPGPVPLDWSQACEVPVRQDELAGDPAAMASFDPLPPEAAKPKSFEAWSKALSTHLTRSRPIRLQQCVELDLISRPGESARDFQVRLRQTAREQRDARVETLKARYGPRVAALQERIRRAEQALAVQQEQASSAQMSGVLSIGSALIGAFLGRKLVSSATVTRAASAAKGVARTSKERSDVSRAQEDLDEAHRQLLAIESKLSEEADVITAEIDAATTQVTQLSIKPKRGSVTVRAVVLAWSPQITPTSAASTTSTQPTDPPSPRPR